MASNFQGKSEGKQILRFIPKWGTTEQRSERNALEEKPGDLKYFPLLAIV